MEVQKGEVKFEVKLEEGKVKLSVSYDGKGADSEIIVKLEPEYFVEKLTAAIPGKVDDQIGAGLLALLKIKG